MDTFPNLNGLEFYPESESQALEFKGSFSAGCKEGFEDLELVPFLYNTCHGGYGFSKNFLARLNERRATAELPPIKYSHELSPKSMRSDPMVTTLFQEMGSDSASGPCADLELDWFPLSFMKYVELSEYDGEEHVQLETSTLYSDLLTEFLKEWKTTPELTVAHLNTMVETIQAKLARYREFNTAWWKCRSSPV